MAELRCGLGIEAAPEDSFLKERLVTNRLSAKSIFAALLFVMLIPATHATTIGECQRRIEDLHGELAGVEVRGGNPERTRASLESKLAGAITKLDQTKFCDAEVKLEDFRNKVLDLAVPNRKGESKMDSGDADNLAIGADEAIDCVRDLDAYRCGR